ncbi:MAG: hypothetical protein ACXWPM_11215 [Bdellovibrionota bacterium]
MQEHKPYSMTPNPSSAQVNAQVPNHAASSTASSSVDDLARIFNTALVSTHVSSGRNFSQELHELMENPAFRAILNSVRQFSRLQGIPERQACEQIIQTFRKMDGIWGEYVFQEGVDRLRQQGGQA